MASATGFTSNTKDPVILKVVCDYAYFLKLQQYEKENQELRASHIKELQNTSQPTETDQYGAGAEGDFAMDLDQIGEGRVKQPAKPAKSDRPAATDSDQKLRKVIRQEVDAALHRYFSKPPTNFVDYVKNIKVKDVMQHIPYVNQLFGRGSVDEDFLPNGVKNLDDTEVHAGTSNFANQQGPLYYQLDKSKPIVSRKKDFLKLIPLKFHSKASQLLDYFNNHTMNVRWNDEGNITVDDEYIPDSNIYTIFQELYKRRPSFNVPGYVELASFLVNAGLGHLISKSKYWFTVRPKKFKPIQQIGSGEAPWYYIGD